MELEPLKLDSTAGKVSPVGSNVNEEAAEMRCLDSVSKDDDRPEFVLHAKRLFVGEDAESERTEALKLLSTCCRYDSINCASSIINGDVGPVPYIDDVCGDTGLSPLHTAAESHARRCVEMLLNQRARTDMRSRDERALIPLELSLLSLDVTWNPTSDSTGDLILLLGDKDLTVVKVLAEKTKEVDTLAYVYAKSGAIVSLAALLTVATEKIRGATVELRDDDDSVPRPRRKTIYEAVIQEAMESVCSEKRIVLLREIELLQLFGAAVFSEPVDKQTSPLISIVQAGDEAVLELLLNTNIDVNETDAEGDTVIQCSLKGSSVPHKHQTRIMQLLIAHGARVSQKNKLGLSALHFAAANGNLSALEILLAANPKLVHVKTVTKETPIFFAVKNNHLDCVELLLRYGASTEIHNLRKQRRRRSLQLPRTRDILENEIKGSRKGNNKFFEEHGIRKSVRKEINKTEPRSQISHHTSKNKLAYVLWEVDEKTPSEKLFAEDWKKLSGPVRNQRSHGICWSYSGTDLYSARRLITKEDEEFRVFSAKYLAFYACPMLRWVESNDGERRQKHHCHGYNIASTLKFIKENGVPEEDPEEAEQDFCCISDAPDEHPSVLYKLHEDVQVPVSDKLEDLYEMLLHQPVGAHLHAFTPGFLDIGSDIYEGPTSDECTYGIHAVVVTAIKRINGKLVAIVKSSHGTSKGKKGYIKVSLTKMVLGLGRGNDITSPSFLLTSFTCPVIPSSEEPTTEKRGKKRGKKSGKKKERKQRRY